MHLEIELVRPVVFFHTIEERKTILDNDKEDCGFNEILKLLDIYNGIIPNINTYRLKGS